MFQLKKKMLMQNHIKYSFLENQLEQYNRLV